MNTTRKFDRKTVLAICVFSTAACLPFTTSAQNLSKTADSMQGMQTESRIQQAPIGFSETDPAARTLMDGTPVRKMSHNMMMQQQSGFAEMDPTNSMYQHGANMPTGTTKMVCSHDNGKPMVHGANGSHGMMGNGRFNGHC